MTANTNFDKLYLHICDNDIWDDIYMNIADDHDGNTYIIVDSWDDLNKLAVIAKDVLELKDDKFYLDEVLNVNIVFSDEYITCSDCGHIIRISPDSYSWKPDFYLGDGFIVCNKCFNDIESYQEEYIESKINNPKEAINNELITEEQLENIGFKKLDIDYQYGFYDRHDNPVEIYENLSSHYDEIVFFVDNVGQFHTDFTVFVKGGNV